MQYGTGMHRSINFIFITWIVLYITLPVFIVLSKKPHPGGAGNLNIKCAIYTARKITYILAELRIRTYFGTDADSTYKNDRIRILI
jgi:hypothetical protein